MEAPYGGEDVEMPPPPISTGEEDDSLLLVEPDGPPLECSDTPPLPPPAAAAARSGSAFRAACGKEAAIEELRQLRLANAELSRDREDLSTQLRRLKSGFLLPELAHTALGEAVEAELDALRQQKAKLGTALLAQVRQLRLALIKKTLHIVRWTSRSASESCRRKCVG